MVKVYFEHGTHAEMVAVFSSDEDYMKMSDQLDKSAEKKDCFVTESVIDEDIDEEIEEFLESIQTENVRKDFHQKLINGVIGGIIFFDNMITIIGSKPLTAGEHIKHTTHTRIEVNRPKNND